MWNWVATFVKGGTPKTSSVIRHGQGFSYSYDGTNRGEAIVNKAMYIVYNEEAEAFTDLVEKFDRWHGALQKGN